MLHFSDLRAWRWSSGDIDHANHYIIMQILECINPEVGKCDGPATCCCMGDAAKSVWTLWISCMKWVLVVVDKRLETAWSWWELVHSYALGDSRLMTSLLLDELLWSSLFVQLGRTSRTLMACNSCLHTRFSPYLSHTYGLQLLLAYTCFSPYLLSWLSVFLLIVMELYRGADRLEGSFY